jgi:cold shock CspA family protein
MAKSQQSFNKKEKEKKRLKKRKDKQARKEERRAASAEAAEAGTDSMIAYVDEHGNITDTPPDLSKKKKIDASKIELGVPKRDQEDENTVRKGRVAFFNHSKGYGFINELDTQEKFFVHVNGLIDEIDEGDKVSFELERGLKGMNAIRVKKI